MNKIPSSDIRKVFGKLTIKEPYTRTKWFSVRFRGYMDLLRAFTLLAPIVVSMFIMVASLIKSGKTIPDNWWITIGQTSVTIAIVNAASNALNQATDVAADKISKPYRPVPLGIVKPDEAQSLAYILYLFALLRSATINAWFGIFIFLIMVFTVTYSLPPRMKKCINIRAELTAQLTPIPGALTQSPIINRFSTGVLISGFILSIVFATPSRCQTAG